MCTGVCVCVCVCEEGLRPRSPRLQIGLESGSNACEAGTFAGT